MVQRLDLVVRIDYTPNGGDCNDCNPTINPGAIQIPGDKTDYACDGKPGFVPDCSPISGLRDATALAQAMELCDPRFFKSAELRGPADDKARKVEPNFGVLLPKQGPNMAYLSTGIAADKADPDFDPMREEDQGTNLSDSNTQPHPYPYVVPNPTCAGAPGVMTSEPVSVNDYTELVLKLHAPTNVRSFSFDFQFFSAEYPTYVCSKFNDEFLVLQDSKEEFQMPTNIAFDMHNNPVTVNNGFFTVCTNDPSKPYTQRCTQSVSDIMGTGYEDSPRLVTTRGSCTTTADCTKWWPSYTCMNQTCTISQSTGQIPGGSTGWLTTTSPVTPGEDVTLHFIIFDEGDHILDSSVLIDNFRWGTSAVPCANTIDSGGQSPDGGCPPVQ
jgi:hypothetical protein